MLNRLKKLFSSKPSNKAKMIPQEQHQLPQRQISSAALSVIQRLNNAKHDAHLVGGGVRDLLLKGSPKDFDVATDATPEQVRKLFRGARIIGKRFRIVHVRMGREIIEVTTYRANHDSNQDSKASAQSSQGMLLRDNVYGDLPSDAARRDFTINALYYSSQDGIVRDFVGGIHDIKHRKIRIIGDPVTRYKEDPVRLLRAIRFAAKLDFSIDSRTEKPIPRLANLLENISSARLFDETLKLFLNGSALRTYELLKQYSVLPHLFPQASSLLADNTPHVDAMIRQTMINTDKRIQAGKRVTPAFLFAAILWVSVRQLQAQKQKEGMSEFPALIQATKTVINKQCNSTSIPKRFQQAIREIYELQLRLPKRRGKSAQMVFEHPRFRAAYDFLLLREECGETNGSLGKWWTDFQEANPTEKKKMIDNVKPQGNKPRRRRPRKPKQNND